MKNLKTIGVLIIASILLCFFGWYNRFPLLHWDSAVYIYPAFQYYVPVDRPVIYGLFVRLSSLNHTLWLTILCQGFLTALTIFFYFRYVFQTKRIYLFFLITIFLIALFSYVSVYVSMILPDIFISLTILNLGLLIFTDRLNKWDAGIITMVFMLGLTVHNSHFVIMGIVLVVFSVLLIFNKFRSLLKVYPFRLMHIWAAFLVAFLLSSSIHYMFPRTGEWVYKRSFTTGPGGYVFLIAKLNQEGILKKYLDNCCHEKDYKLCRYKDSLPSNLDFIWKKYSPLHKTGGWYANRKEYNAINLDILTTPKYLTEYVMKSLEGTAEQFFSFNVDTIPCIAEIPFPDSVFTSLYPVYKNQYRSSLQNKKDLDPIVKWQNKLQMLAFFPALCFLLILPFMKMSLKTRLFGIYVLGTLIVNAFVCSSLSTVDPRYQSRLLWIMILPVVFACTGISFKRQSGFRFTSFGSEKNIRSK